MFEIKVLLQLALRLENHIFLPSFPSLFSCKAPASGFFNAILVFIEAQEQLQKKNRDDIIRDEDPTIRKWQHPERGKFRPWPQTVFQGHIVSFTPKKGDEQSLHTSSKNEARKKGEEKRIMSIVSRSKSISRFRTSQERKFFDHGYQTIRMESLIP